MQGPVALIVDRDRLAEVGARGSLDLDDGEVVGVVDVDDFTGSRARCGRRATVIPSASNSGWSMILDKVLGRPLQASIACPAVTK